MVREPVSRTYSSYLMEQSNSNENRDFDAAIKETLNDQKSWKYISYGFYINYINRILKYYNEKNLKVIILEDFKQSPQIVLSEIFEWLNIDSQFTLNVNKIHNKGGTQKSKLYGKLIKNF